MRPRTESQGTRAGGIADPAADQTMSCGDVQQVLQRGQLWAQAQRAVKPPFWAGSRQQTRGVLTLALLS
jgi:hypothetical protein